MLAARADRGVDTSDVWHGATNDKVNRSTPLLWRRRRPRPVLEPRARASPSQRNWKLLFNGDGNVPSWQMDYRTLGRQNGAFFEAQDHSGAQPQVVKELRDAALAWNAETACPFGAAPGTCTVPSATGCDKYPFPGLHH